MEQIDWLALDASAKATEEQLDMPYAWHNNRIYTRREFEELQNKAQKTKMCANIAMDNKIINDKLLFFQNIDYILSHNELIFANNELANSSPVFFGIESPLIDRMSYNVATILQKWLDGSWKRKCSECGNEGYLYSVHAYKVGNIYCPHCKKIVTVDISGEANDMVIGNISRDSASTCRKNMQGELSKVAKTVKTAGDETSKQLEKCETATTSSPLEVAQMHGWNIEGWLRKIKENEALLKECEDIKQGRKLTKVGEFLARIKKLAGE